MKGEKKGRELSTKNLKFPEKLQIAWKIVNKFKFIACAKDVLCLFESQEMVTIYENL